MTPQQLEDSLRDENKGSVALHPGERMHIIMMLHGKKKPESGGYYVHASNECLQVVFNGECDCGHEGPIVWFPTGCGGNIPESQIQPITWKWDAFESRRRAEAS